MRLDSTFRSACTPVEDTVQKKSQKRCISYMYGGIPMKAVKMNSGKSWDLADLSIVNTLVSIDSQNFKFQVSKFEQLIR